MTDIDEEKRRIIWVVSPHASSEFDEWWGPAETEEDHQAALAYATERLEALWDGMDGEDSETVTIERRLVTETEWQELQAEL